MCELFGISTKKEIEANELLRKFFRHSKVQQDGWGLALLDNDNVSIEKEPVKALDSRYLTNRLHGRIHTKRMMAHIRKATMGDVNFDNTHPFTGRDESGRQWVMVHNGTIFDAPALNPYLYKQRGNTDSERLFLYILDRINQQFLSEMNFFDVNERLELIDDIVVKMSCENKLNLMLYDGEYFYVHKNEEETLFYKEIPQGKIFSTRPLDNENWRDLPMNRLLVYRDGRLIYTGTQHHNTYVFDESKMKLLYLAYSGL